MARGWTWTAGVALLLLTLAAPSCVDISCTVSESRPTGAEPTVGQLPTTQASRTTVVGGSTTTAHPTPLRPTTSSATTTSTSSTTTTLGPVDAYKARMLAWKNTYATDMAGYYEVVSSMENPLRPSDGEVQAARNLDELLVRSFRPFRSIFRALTGFSPSRAG